MSIYDNQLSFAKRIIELYKNKDTNGYEFTAAAGVLLNIFSVICPDTNGKFIDDIDKELLSKKNEIPQFININKSILDLNDIETYFKNIRNGLAHKTEENFASINDNDHHIIISLNISSKQNRTGISLSLDELKTIINLLDKIIDEKVPKDVTVSNT